MKANCFRFWLALAMVAGLCPRVHAAITVLDDWHMGESDSGAINGGSATNTFDAVGSITLTNQLSVGVFPAFYPGYTANVSSQAALFAGSSLSEFYSSSQSAKGKVISNLTDNFGLEVWVYPTVASGGAVIAYNGNTGTSGWGLYQAGTNCYVLFGSVIFSPNSVPLPINTWSDLALVRNNGVTTLYINGLPGFTLNSTPINPSGSFLLAANNSGGEAFTGMIDEVRVFTFGAGQFSPTNLLVNPLLVTTKADSANAGVGSLRYAGAAANPGSTITFVNSLSGQIIILTNGGITLNSNVTIDASALAGGINISGTNGTAAIVVNATNVVFQNLAFENCQNIGGSGGAIANHGGLTLNNCTISGNNSAGLFGAGGGIDNSGTLTLNHCTVSNNRTQTGGSGGGIDNDNGGVTLNSCQVIDNSAGEGGGIYNQGISILTLNNCTLLNNSANSSFGGAIGIQGGTVTLTNCSISGNSAGQSGGGIYNGGVSLTLDTCTVSGNQTVGSPGTGGGICNQTGSLLALTNCTVSDNQTEGSGGIGGGLYNDGSATLDFCTLMNNMSGNSGGGIYNFSDGTATLNNCSVSANKANASSGSGAGIYFYGGTLTLNNCTLANNSEPGFSTTGGGIYSRSTGTLTLTNCTLSGNSANSGGGLYILTGGNCLLVNTIVAGNSASISNNFYGAYSGNNNFIGGNAQLASLGNYGGPTQTMPPQPGSPVIDAGDDSVTNILATDQRGYPRLAGLHVDIGAVEGVANAAVPIVLNGATQLGNGSFQFGFTNYEDLTFTVFAGTNLALPFNLWSNLGPVVETPAGSGQFQFTDPGATNFPQRFYRVTSP